MIRYAFLAGVLFVNACGSPEDSAPKVTGLYVESIEGSGLTYSIVNLATGLKVGESDTDVVIALEPGEYRLHRRGREKWAFAEKVLVVADEISHVKLAAIRLTADPTWDDVRYDIRIPADDGDAVMAPLDPNVLVPIAAGEYDLTHHYFHDFQFGRVAMAPGEIGEAHLGALQATTSVANDGTGFAIYELDCETVLDGQNDGRYAHAVPPGHYCIRDKDVNRTMIAADLVVDAGEVTSF